MDNNQVGWIIRWICYDFFLQNTFVHILECEFELVDKQIQNAHLSCEQITVSP